MPRLTMRIHSMIALLTMRFGWLCAVLSRQKSISRRQVGCSPLRSAYQMRVAHSAPPDVPLMPTRSNSSRRRTSLSAFSTPAVKAVWLPPPWQASAIFVRIPESSAVSVNRSRARTSEPD
jgi:hypothetical protein